MPPDGEPFSLSPQRAPPIDTHAVAAAVAQSLTTEPRNDEPIIFDEEVFVLGEAVTARGTNAEDASPANAVQVSRCAAVSGMSCAGRHMYDGC